MPASSLYWTQKSVSRISAAAAKRSSAASPRVRRPPNSGKSAWAREGLERRPALVARVAVVSPFLRKARRLVACFISVQRFSIGENLLSSGGDFECECHGERHVSNECCGRVIRL